MAERAQKLSLFDAAFVWRAMRDALIKLHPRTLMRNPVMFVVEVVAAVTTILFMRDLFGGTESPAFVGQIAAWLWFTVLFANFAEAVAEGRGKAQADTLRHTKTQTIAKRSRSAGTRDYELIPATDLQRGDLVIVEVGDFIPGDGDVIDGIASVDESAITGESAPVIHENGGDRSAVTGGTRVLSDWIKVHITSNPGETFLDRMIALVEGA
jgi:K+-transporting ATPase ATPase B chain